MTHAIDCREVFRVHRTREGDTAALQGLTLAVDAGEIVACLGPSGSGKSSLIGVLAGLQRASAGTAAVFGHDLGRLGARRRARLRRELIGLVDQHAEQALPPDLAIGEGVALGLRLRGTGPRDARRRSDELLGRVGLADLTAARPAELSGGERQRAAVCAALAHRPRLLLADEPTGDLDAASSEQTLRLIVELARADGATVLLVTHDPAATRVADRTIALRDGRLSDEQRAGTNAVVVARGGWLRVPERLLAQAGIGDRVQVSLDAGGVRLAPVPGAAGGPAANPVAPPGPPGRSETVAPVEVHADAVTRAHRGRTVLAPVTASFRPGSLTAITGRSGSGKTTLLRILAGLEPADGGQVSIGPTRLGDLDREARARLRAADVAVVGQGLTLAGHLTALEQTHADPDRAAGWLNAVGLAARRAQRVERLSAGERQRVALARALASGRGLLLLDEPSSRLDRDTTVLVAELLAGAAREQGRTVVCTTHDPLVADRADARLALG